MFGWEFYDVETQDKETKKLIKRESYITIDTAKNYIRNTIEMKCLDYNEKLVLIKRKYDNDRELIEEKTLKEYEN